MSSEETLILQGVSEDRKFRVYTYTDPFVQKRYITKVLWAEKPDDIQSLFEVTYTAKDEAREGHKIVLFVLNTKMYHALHTIALVEESAEFAEEDRQVVQNENNWHIGGV